MAFPNASWLVRLLAPGFGPDQVALTVTLVRILPSAIVFMGLAGWAQGVVCLEVLGWWRALNLLRRLKAYVGR